MNILHWFTQRYSFLGVNKHNSLVTHFSQSTSCRELFQTDFKVFQRWVSLRIRLFIHKLPQICFSEKCFLRRISALTSSSDECLSFIVKIIFRRLHFTFSITRAYFCGYTVYDNLYTALGYLKWTLTKLCLWLTHLLILFQILKAD